MQFTSGTQAMQGRTVNHDEYPYVCYNWPGSARIDEPVPGCADIYEPRPEFAILDNPILMTLRTHVMSGADVRGQVQVFLNTAPLDWVPYLGATPEQIEHARRVLTLLAALS